MEREDLMLMNEEDCREGLKNKLQDMVRYELKESQESLKTINEQLESLERTIKELNKFFAIKKNVELQIEIYKEYLENKMKEVVNFLQNLNLMLGQFDKKI